MLNTDQLQKTNFLRAPDWVENTPSELKPTAISPVSIRSPKAGEFFRVHPESDRIQDSFFITRLPVVGLRFKDEPYLLHPNLVEHIPFEVTKVYLVTAANESGEIFLWPIPMPGPDGHYLLEHQEAFHGAFVAKHYWTRKFFHSKKHRWVFDPKERHYQRLAWAESDFPDLLSRIPQNRFIQDFNHSKMVELGVSK